MVGDGHAMGVTAQVLEYILRSTKGWFGVHDPVFAGKWPQPGRKGLGMGERCKLSGQVQLAALECKLQAVDELAAEHASQCGDGKEEARMRSDPTAVIKRESAGGDDTVGMGMNLEFLIPGVEHTEEADLGAETDWVACDFQQGFGTGAK